MGRESRRASLGHSLISCLQTGGNTGIWEQGGRGGSPLCSSAHQHPGRSHYPGVPGLALPACELFSHLPNKTGCWLARCRCGIHASDSCSGCAAARSTVQAGPTRLCWGSLAFWADWVGLGVTVRFLVGALTPLPTMGLNQGTLVCVAFRFPGRGWDTWRWGAVCFVLSQASDPPLLT